MKKRQVGTAIVLIGMVMSGVAVSGASLSDILSLSKSEKAVLSKQVDEANGKNESKSHETMELEYRGKITDVDISNQVVSNENTAVRTNNSYKIDLSESLSPYIIVGDDSPLASINKVKKGEKIKVRDGNKIRTYQLVKAADLSVVGTPAFKNKLIEGTTGFSLAIEGRNKTTDSRTVFFFNEI